MAGKGSRARPLSVSKSKFDDNWDRIFKKKEVEVVHEIISNTHGSHADTDTMLDKEIKVDK